MLEVQPEKSYYLQHAHQLQIYYSCFECFHYVGTVVSFTGKGHHAGHFRFVLVKAGFTYGFWNGIKNNYEYVEILKHVKKKNLKVQNKFMPDEHASIHSPLGYLWDAMGITVPNSLNILSDTSAVIFLGFFNFALVKRVFTWPTFVTQTGEFSVVTWTNHNRL